MVKATEVNAGLAESNGRLLLGIWRELLHVNCALTARTPGSAPGPTLGNEYGKTLPFTLHHKVTGLWLQPQSSRLAAPSGCFSVTPTLCILWLIMCNYDVIHKTRSTYHIATPPEDIRNMPKNLVKIGRVVS